MATITCCSNTNKTKVLTFAHSVAVPLQLTVLHTGNNVKQSKDLLLAERSPCGDHETAWEFTGTVIYDCVVPGLSWTGKEDTRVSKKTDWSKELNLFPTCDTEFWWQRNSYPLGTRTGSWIPARQHNRFWLFRRSCNLLLPLTCSEVQPGWPCRLITPQF